MSITEPAAAVRMPANDRRQMKVAGIALLAMLIATACSHQPATAAQSANRAVSSPDAHYELRNPLAQPRPASVVAVPLPAQLQRQRFLQAQDVASGAQLPLQFPASSEDRAHALVLLEFAAGQRRTIRIQPAATPPDVQAARASGRHVPERKDDFAWENDRIAFRMYGPALAATGEVSSGIDVWAKRVRTPVIDRWYAGDDYHVDHGEGMDFFTVGKRRGCGGIAMLQDDVSAVSGNYIRWRQLSNGPLRVEFELDYAPWGLPGKQVSETKRISLDAGSNFSRIQSRFSAVGGTAPLPLAAGIGESGRFSADPDGHWISIWGDEHPGKGRIACAIVMAAAGQPRTVSGQFWLSTTVSGTVPATLQYYAGGTWSRGLDFDNARAWQTEVEAFAQRVSSPVEVRALSAD